MFHCNECDKSYATQNSLARHRHNHRRTRQHVCSTCNVIFYRRDLLSRHLKLHEKEAASGKTGTAVARQAPRRRCHTACLRCRELRVKCSGVQPCTSCADTGSHCDYAPNNRVSRQIRPESREASGEDQEDVDGLGDDINQIDSEMLDPNHGAASNWREIHQLGTFPSTAVPVLGAYQGSQTHFTAEAGPSPSGHLPVNEIAMSYSVVPDFAAIADHGTFGLDVDNQYTSGIDHDPHVPEGLMDLDPLYTDTVQWPTLHESLFLSGRPMTSPDIFEYSDLDFNGQFFFGDTTSQIPSQSAGFDFGTLDASTQSHMRVQTGLVASNASGSEDTESLVVNKTVLERGRGSRATAATGSFPQNSKVSDDTHSDQTQVVNELVTFASCYSNSSTRQPEPPEYWKGMSGTINVAFHLDSPTNGPQESILSHFVDLYLKHFGPLWPLISLQNLDLDQIHPLLYLVLTSIGAMYGGPAACKYGVCMHNSVRVPLTMAVEPDDGHENALWLAQARLLTQVAALYFGQTKAFSYSQHLVALLVAQARRMDLFSSRPAKLAMKRFRSSKGSMPDADRLDLWLQLEARRRLAFGIFRGAMYLSVLLHTTPLVLLEEIDLEFPSSNAVWRGEPMDPRVCLQMIENDRSPSAEMRASDIYRIAMDRYEPLPPLDPASHELLIFGFQWPVWQFSRDQGMFYRLTGQADQVFDPHRASEGPSYSGTALGAPGLAANFAETELLDRSPRKMQDLRADSLRFRTALQKWEHALPLVKTFVQMETDRSSVLSGLILYHLGYVRLNAPIEDLHQIQYRLADNRALDDDLVDEARKWANSPSGRVAAERACTIWSLISREAVAAKDRRAKFNLLAFTALHHCAVLLWTFAGANKQTDQASSPKLLLKPPSDSGTPIMISKSDCSRMLASFIQLYDLVSPARWSSFARAVDVLRKCEFPGGW